MFSKDTLKTAFKNKSKRWVPVTEKEKEDPLVAMNRFRSQSYFPVSSVPKFKIPKSASIYTVGSCFARNVEVALVSQGIDIVGYDFTIDPDHLLDSIGVMNNKASVRSVLNKYSSLSIVGDFERIIYNREIVDNGFIQVTEDKWTDPLIAGSVMKPLSFDELVDVRANVDALITKSLSADIIFITLGLNEVWFDHKTQCYLNGAPPPVLMRTDTERFEFIVPSYSEVIGKLRSTILLLKSNSEKDLKFIVTVSPIPLATTWTAEDVVVANTQSKATLRVAAAELVKEFDFVDYYPSYEMVMNTPKELAWNDDYLHVKQDMVKFVIGNFVERYIEK